LAVCLSGVIWDVDWLLVGRPAVWVLEFGYGLGGLSSPEAK